MSDLKIEAGKFYKTRNGRKARIYATDGSTACPIHGAILSDSEWYQYPWRSDGSATCGAYNSDLISPWIDPPVVDWDRFPKHIVAVAMDRNGEWHGYTKIPAVIPSDPVAWTIATPKLYSMFDLYKEHTPAFTGDWRDSLAVRPGCGE